jgi:anti-anti-sigma factor
MYRTVKKVEEVKFVDDLSSSDVLKIENEIIFIIKRGLARLVIDLSELRSIDQRALELLEKCAEFARERNGWLVLVNPNLNVRRLVRASYSSSIFPIHLSFQSAINSMSN